MSYQVIRLTEDVNYKITRDIRTNEFIISIPCEDVYRLTSPHSEIKELALWVEVNE